MRHRPLVALAVIVTLTLAIGANTAIFSTVDAVLLKPLPYPDADRLVSVRELNRGSRQATQLVAPVRLEEWHAQNRSFVGLAGSYFENMADTSGPLPERVEAMRTSQRFFSVLGVPAALGRTLTEEEERFGGPRAIVISDAFWRRRLNGDPSIVGRALTVGGVSRTIVGVMPASFRYPTASTEMWVPAQMDGNGPLEMFSLGSAVSAGYFATLRVPVLEGETCKPKPVMNATPDVLVTRAFADRYFPGESPIGHALTSAGVAAGTSRRIVGVVGDVREGGVATDVQPLFYLCGFNQFWPDPIFLARAAPGRPLSMEVIRAAMREIEPNRAVYNVQRLEESLFRSLTQQRLSAILLALFVATALLLAAVGLYGVLAQLVSSRRREIGVRMAMGARPAQIVRSVVAQAATMTAAGVLVGLAGALALAQFTTSLVFGISTRDPVTFGLVPIVLAIVATLAAFVPARRAAMTDPMRALREE